jgi:hypothetical protein
LSVLVVEDLFIRGEVEIAPCEFAKVGQEELPCGDTIETSEENHAKAGFVKVLIALADDVADDILSDAIVYAEDVCEGMLL